MESSDVGSSREEDVEISCDATRQIDLDVLDNVQTPVVHEKENPIEGSEGKSSDPVLGMKFKTEEQAYEFYNEYARKVGFGIRKDYVNKMRGGIVRRRRFCCSREGHSRKEDNRDSRVKQKRNRDSSRTGCEAHIIIARQKDGTYAIDKFNATHNHQCTPMLAHMFMSQRQKTVTFDFLSAKVKGSENVGKDQTDSKYYFWSKRIRSMAKDDAGGVLQYLRQMLVKDPGSFYTVQLDEYERISNIFWADSNMLTDYHAFGDVVCFDTTYRINNYDRPFAFFVGVNHHKQTVVFGAALMYDETISSFEWVLKAFLDAMSGKEPITILTDQDKAIENAISVVMQNANHRICIWHMYQNALKHLNSVFTSHKSLKADFSKCIFDYEEELDFFDAWAKILDKYSLRENTWLRNLFDEREKWALPYGRDTFCADMKSMQRSEAMNSVIKRYLHRSFSLGHFFSQFEKLVSDRRKAEAEADLKMTQNIPVLLINVPILVGARNMYTPEIFKLFQEEYENGMNCTATIQCTIGTIITYKVHSLRKSRDYTVTFDSLQKTIECGCKKFEFTGILCSHALKVLDRADLVEVPDRYILKRWRKDAKVSTISVSTLASEDKSSIPTRYRELMRNSMKLSTKAAITQEAYLLAMEGIKKTMEKLEHLQIHPTSTFASQCIPPHDMGAEPRGESAELHILDVDESGIENWGRAVHF